MTDRTFTATELREVLGGEGTAADKVQALHEMILFPSRPTLADMTPEERRACRRMQCEVRGERRIITLVFNDGHEDLAATLDSSGHTIPCPVERVTPRPDLPRMTWPGDTSEPALPEGWRLADHPNYGRVIVTNTTPDAYGNVYFVAPVPGIIGNDWHSCAASELTYIDTDPEAADATD